MVMLGEFIYRQYPCSAVYGVCVLPILFTSDRIATASSGGGGIFDPPDLYYIDGEVIIDSSPPHGITLTTMATHGHVDEIEGDRFAGTPDPP